MDRYQNLLIPILVGLFWVAALLAIEVAALFRYQF